jgi:hypothetical protein
MIVGSLPKWIPCFMSTTSKKYSSSDPIFTFNVLNEFQGFLSSTPSRNHCTASSYYHPGQGNMNVPLIDHLCGHSSPNSWRRLPFQPQAQHDACISKVVSATLQWSFTVHDHRSNPACSLELQTITLAIAVWHVPIRLGVILSTAEVLVRHIMSSWPAS